MDLIELTTEGLRIKQTRVAKSPIEFNLREVSREKILDYRSSRRPGLVFVICGKYFYTPISKSVIFHLGGHQCSLNGNVCKHLSALPKELGGCPKVSDLLIYSINAKYTTLRDSKRIEKYDFIQFGYETFNVPNPVLTVLECTYCEYSSPVHHYNDPTIPISK